MVPRESEGVHPTHCVECVSESGQILIPTLDRNKKNEKSVGLAELRREQERLLYLCDSIKLSVTKEEARVSNEQ